MNNVKDNTIEFFTEMLDLPGRSWNEGYVVALARHELITDDEEGELLEWIINNVSE